MNGDGSLPKPAAMLSAMWRTLEVAGITQVTEGCEATNSRKNCPQLLQSNSLAHRFFSNARHPSTWVDSRQCRH